ncbi:AmmeMemoRadiSam system protein A [Desulfovulcanus sp.]
MDNFVFDLTDEEKNYLKELAFLSIKSSLEGQEINFPQPPTEKLNEHFGAFVTLKINGLLRGCIGHIVGDEPLWQIIIKMAREAAFEDPRFPPLSKAELDRVEIEISILSPLQKVVDLNKIVPGKHGLLVHKGCNSGLLLPQVATEWGWDRQTFLAHTCQKAGLPANCWQDPDTEIYWFEALVF